MGDDFLVPVSTKYFAESEPRESKSTKAPQSQAGAAEAPRSLQEALSRLEAEPDYSELIRILRFLRDGRGRDGRCSILSPGVESARIVQVLVESTIPSYWTVLLEDAADTAAASDGDGTDLRLLTFCLLSLTGLNALLRKIRELAQNLSNGRKDARDSAAAGTLREYLDVLSTILSPETAFRDLWVRATSESPESLKRSTSLELTSFLAGGKVISVVAEADDLSRETTDAPVWIGDASRYTDWLGRSISSWARTGPGLENAKYCSMIFAKASSLGHRDKLLQTVVDRCFLVKGVPVANFLAVVAPLPLVDQKRLLSSLLAYFSSKHLAGIDARDLSENKNIAAVGAAISIFVGDNAAREASLLAWLTNSSGAGLGDGIAIRRAVFAAISRDEGVLSNILDKSIAQFGDQLYIKHVPILQQDAHAQVLLLAAGYLSRLAPKKLSDAIRSGAYLETISNRISASQSRARFLGMVVGEALSSIVHKKETRLTFQFEDSESEERDWYQSLLKIADEASNLEVLQSSEGSLNTKMLSARPKSKPKQKEREKVTSAQVRNQKASQPKAMIQEVESSESDDDGDLKPYGKPLHDPEDSDDDPTMISRDKVARPVYVRNLVAYFRDEENYDKHKLALETAPGLIRRKADFGTEVSTHAVELAAILVALDDKFELDNFWDLRLQGLVSLVSAKPEIVGPWMARMLFAGDYSISQRASILVALGLGARILGGVDKPSDSAAFPSERLPEKLEKLYPLPGSGDSQLSTSKLKALPGTAIDNASQSLADAFLAPLAASAADSVSGPDELKLSTFTSRLKTTKSLSRPRIKAIPNTTASSLASNMFFPLVARFQHALRSSSARRGVLFQPYLLSTLLRTLGLILHAAGPSTLALPQMTLELWGLILGLRSHCVGELGVTNAALLALVALLEVNTPDGSAGGLRRLCEAHGKEVVETRDWVAGIFEKLRGGEKGTEENDVQMLAAAILIKLNEATENYRSQLMGVMVDQ